MLYAGEVVLCTEHKKSSSNINTILAGRNHVPPGSAYALFHNSFVVVQKKKKKKKSLGCDSESQVSDSILPLGKIAIAHWLQSLQWWQAPVKKTLTAIYLFQYS